MRAFYFANNAGSIQTESDGRRIVGVISDLEPGNYLVSPRPMWGQTLLVDIRRHRGPTAGEL